VSNCAPSDQEGLAPSLDSAIFMRQRQGASKGKAPDKVVRSKRMADFT
jgi:hypothetical protein